MRGIMKRLMDELVIERKFLKLYYDKTITQVNIGRQLRDDELRDVYQGLNVSKFVTNFTHNANIDQTIKIQKHSIINNGLKSNNVITHLDLHENNFNNSISG